MQAEQDEFIPTRRTLLVRLRDLDDQESWKEFFETYWKLIYKTALKGGLTEAEAQDVVQETVISVAKNIPEFRYDPNLGSFKAWLMKLIGWRVTDQLRKRMPNIARHAPRNDGPRTSTVERIPDPQGFDPAAVWDAEWESNILDIAIERVKRKVDPKQFQLFDLNVLQNCPVKKITRVLRVNPARVYLAKYRVSALVRKEAMLLRKRPPWPGKVA